MSNITTKVIYFTASAVPTARENEEIARLNKTRSGAGLVVVRNATKAADAVYGSGQLETCDYVAGTIPTAYNGVTSVTIPGAHNPDNFNVFPAALAVDHAVAGVVQLSAVKAEIDPITGLAIMTNLAADASVGWVSSDATKASVGASTGIVTPVAAGSATITATLTAATKLTSVTATATTDLVNKTAHGLVTGDKVDLVAATGATGLSAGSSYYVIGVDANTFKLATSLANALTGTAIDITADGSAMTVVKTRKTSTCVVTVA